MFLVDTTPLKKVSLITLPHLKLGRVWIRGSQNPITSFGPPPSTRALTPDSYTYGFIEFCWIKSTSTSNIQNLSLYTNIPQEEGTNIVCEAYEKFHNHNAPIPTYLRECSA